MIEEGSDNDVVELGDIYRIKAMPLINAYPAMIHAHHIPSKSISHTYHGMGIHYSVEQNAPY